MKKLAHVLAWFALSGSLATGMALGCASGAQTTSGGDSSGGTTGGDSCQVGTFRACTCSGLQTGTQACAADGTWGECACTTTPIPDAGSDAPAVCGDGVCDGSETCDNCPADCGDCPACSSAPGCTGASSVPSSPTALATFDNMGMSMYTSGVGFGPSPASVGCSDPLLKMRVSQVVVHKNGAPGSLEMFCIVQADDGQSSQLMITPDFMKIEDNNPPLTLSPSSGTFWGEAVNGVKLSQFNITVTYQCYMELTPGTLQNVLTAVAGFAGAAASIPGNPYGWAFGVGGAAAAAGAAATATGTGATPLLNVQQTIDSTALLKLTNGYTWAIEQTGSTKADGDCDLFESCDWDWEVDVEAWGCAAPQGQIPTM
jgi:hypothetical protein